MPDVTDDRLAALEKLAATPRSLVSGDELWHVLKDEVPALCAEVRHLRRRLDIEGGGEAPAAEDVAALKKVMLESVGDYGELFILLLTGLRDLGDKYKARMVSRLEKDRARFGGGA